jgi:hypothetical protein
MERQYQHEIAAAYVINPRAVNHVLNEVTHVGSKEEAARRLPRCRSDELGRSLAQVPQSATALSGMFKCPARRSWRWPNS